MLNVTTEEKRVEKMITVTEKEVGDTGIPYLLFKHVEDFGPDFRPPYPMKELIHSPWRRAGRKDFRIDTP